MSPIILKPINMKTVIIKLQIKVDEFHEDLIEETINKLETQICYKDGNVINHYKSHGYEIMILDRNDK